MFYYFSARLNKSKAREDSQRSLIRICCAICRPIRSFWYWWAHVKLWEPFLSNPTLKRIRLSCGVAPARKPVTKSVVLVQIWAARDETGASSAAHFKLLITCSVINNLPSMLCLGRSSSRSPGTGVAAAPLRPTLSEPSESRGLRVAQRCLCVKSGLQRRGKSTRVFSNILFAFWFRPYQVVVASLSTALCFVLLMPSRNTIISARLCSVVATGKKNRTDFCWVARTAAGSEIHRPKSCGSF